MNPATTNQSFIPIKRFKIERLHGYKDIVIDFHSSATIIASENGTGKTTVFNILHSFLTCRFHRLSSFAFSSIEVEFSNYLYPVRLERYMVPEDLSPETEVSLNELSNMSSVPETELYEFLNSAYRPGAFDAFRNHQLVKRLHYGTPYSISEIENLLNSHYSKIQSSLSQEAKEIAKIIKDNIGHLEIIFLPTYRRIERPLLRPAKRESRRVRPTQNRMGYDDIVFGLADVEQKLAELGEEIERRSNVEYRTLSARILEEMLQARGMKMDADTFDLPDIESLSRFLNRVIRTENRLNEVFKDIDNLYASGSIRADENWFLRYFLSRLNVVINHTREIEQLIERFIEVCNSYLSTSSDGKALSLDPSTLRVMVMDLWASREISLDALSSGEKQIVSLMAKLYLNQTKKLVLIDEPELSLSIDWQRRVLPDIVNSGSVVQMLAITHSPFVFENELDDCAIPLQISLSQQSY